MCSNLGGGSSGGAGAMIKTTGLAELKGSEKQIKYANDIRAAYIAELKNASQQVVDFPERKKLSNIFNTGVIEEDPFIKKAKELNYNAWSDTSVRTAYADPDAFRRDLSQSFKNIEKGMETKEFYKLSEGQRIKIFDDGYKKARKKAVDQVNNLLSNVDSSSFWIDNYKSILYK